MNDELDQLNEQCAILAELRDLTRRVEQTGKGFARTEFKPRTRVERPTARRDEGLATV